MRHLIIVLALAGVVISTITLGIQYSPPQPSDHNSLWDSSLVNHSPYAVVAGRIPVAAFGVVGYTLIGLLAYFRRRTLTVISSFFGLAYAIYLTNIQAHIVNVWCVYCLCSLLVMILITLLAFWQLMFSRSLSTS